MWEKGDVKKVPVVVEAIAVSRLTHRLILKHEAITSIMARLNIVSTPYQGKMYVTLTDAKRISEYADR